MLQQFITWLQPHLNFLVLFGLVGQALFMMRFVAQWVVSEREKRSVVPEIFWYFSLGGGLILLTYAIWRKDPVFIIGQATGLFIYVRNIVFIWRARMQRRARTHEAVFEELSKLAASLEARQKSGTGISHEERRAAHDALHTLEAAGKQR
jgi:lipid-A-disaccharide synthase-like uncharacterized protein